MTAVSGTRSQAAKISKAANSKAAEQDLDTGLRRQAAPGSAQAAANTQLKAAARQQDAASAIVLVVSLLSCFLLFSSLAFFSSLPLLASRVADTIKVLSHLRHTNHAHTN